MRPRKRQLHQWKHPFDAYPFEVFLYGSWQPVELIKIESGRITLHFIDNHHMAMEKSDSELRIRSRKATLSDCSCFLRPGIDICVLSASQCSDNSNEFSPDSVWVDAQINSIQRNPHESECSCQYYVNLYVDQGSFGTETRTLSKKIKVVGLDQVSILQRLERNACESQPHRWASSEECSAVPQAKLLLGKFLSDLSWLAVSSVLRKVSFCVRSVENKIVYQILGSDTNSFSLNTDSHINVVNFKVDNGISVPFVAQVARSDTSRISQHAHDSREDEVSPSYNVEGLRRSKRRNVKPERYFGCDDVPELDVGYVRTRPYKIGRWKDDEEPLPLAIVSSLQENCAEDDVDSSKRVNKVSSCRELIVYQRRKKTREVMLGEANQNEHQTPIAAIPLPNEGDISSNYSHLTDIPKPMMNNTDRLNFEPRKQPARSSNAKKVDDFFSSCQYSYSTLKPHRKNSFGPYDDMDLEPRWEGLNSNKGHREERYRSTSSRSRNLDEERAHRDRTLNATAYKEMIDSYLKNRHRIPTKDEPPIMDQWEEISKLGQKKETETSQREEDEELSEMEMLWREMGEALTSSNLLEETKGSNAAIFTENVEKSSGTCQHDYRLNEEIGICCLICGNVILEIKDITPPFLEVEHSVWHQEKKQYYGDESEPKADEVDGFHLFCTPASHDELISEENENIWKLIPELRKKMHGHQKKAFQFLWKNIAGSMEPALMEAESKRRGGCVISHSPGAGKTFLMIAFLVSYLKLFPGNRPLVLAPKTTLYTWYKEFIKWEIPIPVYLIHARRSQREFKQKSLAIPGVPKPTDDVKHVLDCLEKIQNWHEHPSVLVMGYTSFLSLMREDSKFAHRIYMAKALRESPGILIMDEGHNPRSTKSRLRKALMKVETELRILLSGTLFQNNFCEYFNTLCLARPKFVHELLKELDPEYRRKRKVADKARHLLEARARKFFLDNIAKKIDSDNGEERMQGLNVLRNITSGFIDVYDSGNSDTLPGLQIYTLLMNTTDLQHEILKRLHKKMAEYHGYPLEVELLITLGSIHPWLIKTATCAKKFFTLEQLNEVEKYKFDMKIGSKVKFVLSLVHRVVKKEKVLIFCHNIAPVKFFVELFEHYFKWQKGREIFLLNGELELFERGKVIDKFEEPGGVSKVLLASITACAEGISLTAASRVIMLDSEWNPSKTKQAIARAFRPGQQKMVYVYQLLAAGSLEEDKYRRTTWKEWVSSMIFSEAFVEDPSQWQAEKIEDDILREMVEDDSSKSFHMIMKNEKASTN